MAVDAAPQTRRTACDAHPALRTSAFRSPQGTFCLAGALLWVLVIAVGSAVEPLLDDGRHGEYFLFGTVIFVGGVLWLLGGQRARRRVPKGTVGH